MISLQHLSKSFGSVKAVDKLSFEVKAGEIFALLGPNGAGKTTTIKMILGMLHPDTGSIIFQGRILAPEDNSYKAHIGYVPESCALYESLTAGEYMQFVGHLHHLDPALVREKSARMLDAVGLADSSTKLIREFSKGMKQKVLICSAMMHDPDLLILDEPFSGLDANAVSVFKELFRDQANTGKAIIFCSHILEIVERLVDRILIVKDGRQLASGTPEEILKSTGHKSLDRAFNELTGAGDIDTRARDISGIISADRNGGK